MEPLKTKTTNINGYYHTRLLNVDGTLIDEMVCDSRLDIGYCCSELLRWYDKTNSVISAMAIASRNRNKHTAPVGKVWTSIQWKQRCVVRSSVPMCDLLNASICSNV